MIKKHHQRGPEGSLTPFEHEEGVDARAMTYGQHATKGLKFGGQRKNGKVLCLTRTQLAELLDLAYSDGDREKGKWASGVMEDLRRQIKEGKQTLADYGERMARAELLCNLLMEKHGYPRT